MFAKNSGLSVLMTVMTLASVGCSSHKNDGFVDVNTKNLKGSWEVTSVQGGESVVPVYIHSKEADFAGYKATKEIWQYKFDENSVQMTISDEIGVKLSTTSPYQIRGDRMEPTPTDKKSFASVTGFTIVHLYQNHIEAVLDLARSPNQIFILKRINDSDLASTKLKPIAHTLNAKFTAGDKVIEQNFAGTFRDDKGDMVIGCKAYRHAFGITAYQLHKNSDGTVEMDGEDAHLDIAFPVSFDFKKPTESLTSDVTILKPIDAVLKNDPQSAGSVIYSVDQVKCALEITRSERMVTYKASCDPIATTSGSGATPGFINPGVLNITGSCALEF